MSGEERGNVEKGKMDISTVRTPNLTENIACLSKSKGKAIPVTGRGGP
jgi:hypothetical protein